MRKRIQTPYAIAVKKFKQSDEYKRLIDGDSIHLPPKMKQYLETRILLAFAEGWNLALGMNEIIKFVEP